MEEIDGQLQDSGMRDVLDALSTEIIGKCRVRELLFQGELLRRALKKAQTEQR